MTATHESKHTHIRRISSLNPGDPIFYDQTFICFSPHFFGGIQKQIRKRFSTSNDFR